jgi:hypothetical protein
MSIFDKSISQIHTTDLQDLLQGNSIENIRLEFKLFPPDKDEILKKLSSFANTFGGYLVVGAQARSTDGRLEGLPGVDVQAGFKQKIVDWGFGAASPPLSLEISDPIPAPAKTGKVCYVIYVPESDVAPHFLNGRKGIWIRTDEFSARFNATLANETELVYLLDRRKLILQRRFSLLERARSRFAKYREQKYPFSNSSGKQSARLEFCVIPRFPARPLCQQSSLRPIIVSSGINWRQITFPRLNDGIVSQHESEITLQAAGKSVISLFEANTWGLLFYGMELEGNEGSVTAIHLYRLVGSVLLFIKHSGHMLGLMGYSGPILIDISLNSLLGATWIHAPDGMTYTHAGSEFDDSMAFAISSTTIELTERCDGLARDIVRNILYSVNWSELIDTPNQIENVILKGYDFNFWHRPNEFRQ